MAYAHDEAGGVMNPRYIRLRPDMSVEEAIRYLRAQARTPIEVIYYTYVLGLRRKTARRGFISRVAAGLAR